MPNSDKFRMKAAKGGEPPRRASKLDKLYRKLANVDSGQRRKIIKLIEGERRR